MQYKAGSERTKYLESKGMRPGRLVAAPGDRVPDGPSHAVDVTTGETICGFPADELYLFDSIDWERASLIEKCTDCGKGVKR